MWTPKLDDRARLTLPVQYRPELTNHVVVARGQDGCLSVYSQENYEAMMAAIDAASTTDEIVRQYQRWVHSNSADTEVDKLGRIIIAPRHRLWADIERETVVIGVGNRLEIWSPERWEAYSPALDELFNEFNGSILPGA